jgi:hypothetical protein
MRVILKGALAEGAAQREVELAFDTAATREALLAGLGTMVPGVKRYLTMSAETGRPPPLLVLVDGNWIYPGDLIEHDARVEIHPPIAGG